MQAADTLPALISFVTNAPASLLAGKPHVADAMAVPTLARLLKSGAEIEQFALPYGIPRAEEDSQPTTTQERITIRALFVGEKIKKSLYPGRDFGTLFSSIAPTLERLEVRYLDLGQCWDERLVRALRECTALTNLRLFRCGMNRSMLFDAMRAVSAQVETVDLSDNQLRGKDVAELVMELRRAPRLRDVSLNKKRDVDEARGEWLVGLPWGRLRTLEIAMFGLRELGVATMADGMKTALQLEALVLSDNEISPGNDGLGKLVSRCPRLRLLDISWNRLGIHAAAALGNALSHCAGTLSELNIIGCRLGPAGLAALFGPPLLGTRAGAMTTLRMDRNEARNQGINAVADYLLGSGARLEELSVGGNNIDKMGTKKLAQSLSNAKSLRSLDMSDNIIFLQGAVPVLEALAEPGKAR